MPKTSPFISPNEQWLHKITHQTYNRHGYTYRSPGNSIRLPIGYFTLGPAYCANTPFESVSAVYENAWSAVRNIVARCASRGIGVLLDLHALPGGANNGEHSGTNSGKAELWGNRKNLDLATRCLLFIAKEAKNMEGAIGIQVVNEAEWDAKGMSDPRAVSALSC